MAGAGETVWRRLLDAAGNRARLRAILALASVLALDSADKAMLGAAAPKMESALGIGDARLGLLVTTSSAVAALATLPAGVLVDRTHRVRLLAVAVLVWSAALAVAGFSVSWQMLLATQLVLGVVAAVATPAVASLVGDIFEPGERGRIYGMVLTGELAGTGAGFLVVGALSSLLSWRAGFWFLGALGVAVAWLLRRFITEPLRGAQVAHSRRAAEEDRISFWGAARRVLRIRTNRTLILASALGYFYMGGLRTFAPTYVHRRYDLPVSAASTLLVVLGTGAILGTLTSGRIADRLMSHGRLPARPVVAGIAYLAAAALFAAGLLPSTLLVAAPLIFVGAAALGGANPPLDAARLDLVGHELWGRAEAIRSVLRSIFEVPAPLIFGALASRLSGQASGAASGSGLRDSFLIMLASLVIAGAVLVVRARRTYPAELVQARHGED